jgi:hypothetical protein
MKPTLMAGRFLCGEVEFVGCPEPAEAGTAKRALRRAVRWVVFVCGMVGEGFPERANAEECFLFHRHFIPVSSRFHAAFEFGRR